MGGTGRFSRSSLGAVLFSGFIWFLFVGVVNSRTTRSISITIQSTAKSELLKLVGTQRHAARGHLDPVYVSKRRVPNGPDPIHNRRAGKCREPPGRV